MGALRFYLRLRGTHLPPHEHAYFQALKFICHSEKYRRGGRSSFQQIINNQKRRVFVFIKYFPGAG